MLKRAPLRTDLHDSLHLPPSTHTHKHAPNTPTHSTLYESPLESQMLMIFDTNKRLVYTGEPPGYAWLTRGQGPKGYRLTVARCALAGRCGITRALT